MKRIRSWFGKKKPSENNSFKFNSLSPKTNSDIQTYEDALNFAIAREDITNIAVTGNFGAGKSSIIDTYEKNHPKLQLMHIELPHYQSENINGESVDNDVSLYSIEEKIINQLLAQIKPSKIPLSVFHAKQNHTLFNRAISFIAFITFIISGVYLLLANNKSSILYQFKMIPSNISARVSTGLVLLSGILILLQLFLWFSKGWKIHSVKFKSGVVDLDASQENMSSYFDKYMSDVLYLFENTGTNYFVFEDLDRFDIPMIYERLHELNVLLNKRQRKHCKIKIKFLYMLKDDSFVSKDRSKIFDFIIPVIPILSSDNSYQMTLDTLGKTAEGVSDQFLRQLSIYIDDMRLLLNIGNEFQIYSARLRQKNTTFNAGKLLGIITYKNVFPQDFSRLQIGTSFINLVIGNVALLKTERKQSYQQRLLEIGKQLKSANSIQIQDVNELESLYLDFSNVGRINNNDMRTFKNSLEMVEAIHKDNSNISYSWSGDTIEKQLADLSENSEFIERKNAILAKNKDFADNLRQEESEIENKVRKVDSLPLSTLLENKDKSYYENLVSSNGDNFESVLENHYFPLILFLFRQGIIDEHYSDYISYFYPGQITTEDRNFLRSLYDKKTVPINTSVTDPNMVLSYLEKGDFERYSIKNLDIAIFLLKNNSSHSDQFTELIFLIAATKDTEFLFDLLESFHGQQGTISLLLNSIYDKWPHFIDACASAYTAKSENDYLSFIIDVLRSLDEAKLEDDWQSIVNWIENNGEILFSGLNNEDIDSFISKFWNLGCQFKSISNINDDVLEQLCNNNMISVNKSVIGTLISRFTTNTNNDFSYGTSSLLKAKKSWVSEFTRNNLHDIVNHFVKTNNQYVEDEQTVELIINSYGEKLDDSLINELLKEWTKQISDISQIKSAQAQDIVVTNGNVVVNAENICNYLEAHSFKYNSAWTQLINESSEKVTFNSALNSDIQSKVFDLFVKINGIVDEQLSSILKSLQRYYRNGYPDKNISDNNIRLMIRDGIIELNSKNLIQTKTQSFSNLYLYANQNLDQFISLLNQLELSDSEKEKLIYEPGFSDLQVAKIIVWAGLPVDITKIMKGPKSFEAVLNTGIKSSNVSNLLGDIWNYEKGIRSDIFWACSSFPTDTINYLVNNWDKNISEEFISSETVNLSLRRKLFCVSFKQFTINEYIKWLNVLDYPNAFQKVLRRGRQTVQYTEDNYDLFLAFKKNNLLTSKSKVTSSSIQMVGRATLK